jgi:hypothetical protein
MKTISILNLTLLPLLLFAPTANTRAQGTIALGNSAFSRFTWAPGVTPVPVVVGVFWGTNANSLMLVLPVATITESGVLIGASSVFAIPGADSGQAVYLQIRVWHASYGTNWLEALNGFGMYGQTDIRQVTLGPPAGPGTVIWQSSTGTNPNRFYPLVLGRPLTPPAVVEVGVGSFYSLTVDEGNHGTVDGVITVSRRSTTFPATTNSLDFVSSVILSTSDITAVAGVDYIPTNVVVSFGPGETFRQVRIKIIADADSEPDETFAVYLSSAGSFVGINQYPLTVTIREARLLSVRREAGQSIVSLRTTSSQRYAVEYSTNLTNWATLPGAADIAGNGAIIELTDAEGDCCGNRFYRGRLLP